MRFRLGLCLLIGMCIVPSLARAQEGRATGRADIGSRTDGRSVWTIATFQGLTIQRQTVKAERLAVIDLYAGSDSLRIQFGPDRPLRVMRGGKTVVVNSGARYLALQNLLAGSEAVFMTKMFLSGREAVSALEPDEMAVLASAALVASLVGDVDAPRRLAARFVAKHRGIVQQVREIGQCYTGYTNEATAAWDDLQACMNEANQDDSYWNGAYRRLACNATWAFRAESAWFEYLSCIALSPLMKGEL